MKVAICFSGLPRFILETYENLQNNLIREYDVDVFVHTWYESGKLMRDCGDPLWTDFFFREDPAVTIANVYSPKKLMVETPKDFFSKSQLRNYNYKPTLKKYMPHFLDDQGERYFINACHSMWSSIYESNRLKTEYEKQNGFVYDIVVRCRFDEVLLKPISLSEYDLSKIHVSHCCDTPNFPYVRDWFAFSSSENMNLYSNVINNLEQISKQLPDTERMNERFLYEQLKAHSISVQCHTFHSHFIRP